MNRPTAVSQPPLPFVESELLRLDRSPISAHPNFNFNALNQDLALLTEAFRGIDLAKGVVLVTGTGWKELGFGQAHVSEIPYERLKSFPPSSVSGHAGKVEWAKVEGQDTLIFHGRPHWYQLTDKQDLTPLLSIPFLADGLGAPTLLVCQGVGGITAAKDSYCVVSGHISPHDLDLFPGAWVKDLFKDEFPKAGDSDVYSPELRALACEALDAAGIPYSEGRYFYSPKRQFQSDGEIEEILAVYENSRYKAPAVVGKSCVPEALYATQMGMQVLSLCAVLNWAQGIHGEGPDHQKHLAKGAELGQTSEGVLGNIIHSILLYNDKH